MRCDCSGRFLLASGSKFSADSDIASFPVIISALLANMALPRVFCAPCRLLLASLPLLLALRELHIFSTGVLDSSSLSLIASLSRAHCKLQEVSLAFSPAKAFAPADLGVLEW